MLWRSALIRFELKGGMEREVVHVQLDSCIQENTQWGAVTNGYHFCSFIFSGLRWMPSRSASDLD